MTAIKDKVISLSHEFDESEGWVTCETSIHRDDMDAFDEIVKEHTNLKLGKWVAMECETCVGYKGEGAIHVDIVLIEDERDIACTVAIREKCTNYLRTFG